MRIEEIVARARVIPVLEVNTLDAARPLAEALAAGGLKVVELTLRTPCALDALGAMKQAAPDLIIGMGTIRTSADIEKSVAMDADFLVSPGASGSLLGALARSGVPALPGVATPSEAMTAFEAGFQAMKFFPAEPAGGVQYVKALAGPFPDIIFCPTGAITPEKTQAYLALSNVACVGGSWVAPKDLIAKSDWDAIKANAKKAASLK